MAHKHAALMAEYAKDAAITDKPWLLWDVFTAAEKEWESLVSNPVWHPACDYRRKPKTHKVNDVDVPTPLISLTEGQRVYIINGGCLDGVKVEIVMRPKCWEPLLKRGCLFATYEAARENFLAHFPLKD